MYKIILAVIILISSRQAVFSQDVITKIDGTKMKVKITSEDSIKVHFKFERSNGKWVDTFLSKEDVQSIEYATTLKKSSHKSDDADDFIVKKNGVVLRGRIVDEGDSIIRYTLKKNERDEIETINKSDVDHLVYGNASKPLITEENATLGFGLGRDYGGIGLNGTCYVSHQLGLFVGAGYAFAGVGFNGGLKVRLKSAKITKRVVPYLTGMYGYNVAIAVKDAPQYNKFFNGLTFGFGLDIHTRSNGNLWSLALHIPIVDPDAEGYLNSLKGQQIQFKNGIPKVGFSLGFRIKSTGHE